MPTNVEGLKRGHFLVGPLESEGAKRLFMVSRVLGAHSVLVTTNIEGNLVEATISTNEIHHESSEWQKVLYRAEPADRRTRHYGGLLVDGTYMAEHRAKP